MGIAFDAVSNNGANVSVDASWTHTPTGTPRAACVIVVMTNTATDTVNGVTYNAVAMTELAGSPRIHSAGADDSAIHIFWLDNVAAGAVTVAVDVGTATTYRAVCVTMTTDGGAVEVDTTAGNDSAATTTNSLAVTLATTAARDTVCLVGFHSGEAAVASLSTDGTNLLEADYGNQTASWDRKDGAGGSVAITLTLSADTAHGFGVAFGEAAGGTTVTIDTVGTLVFAGQSTGIILTTPITAGTLAFSGQTIQTSVAQVVSVSPGSLTFGGQTVGIGITSPVTPGALTFAGQSVGTVISVGITPGTVTFAGQSIGVTISVGVTAGSIVFQGQTINTSVSGSGTTVTIDVPGSLTFAGQSVGVMITMPVGPGALAFQGQVIGTIVSVPVNPGALAFVGQQLALSRLVALQPGTLAFMGQTIALTTSGGGIAGPVYPPGRAQALGGAVEAMVQGQSVRTVSQGGAVEAIEV